MDHLLKKYLADTKRDWNYITPSDFFNNYYGTNKKYMLIDLRHNTDYNKGHIKGSVNIFWLDILNKKYLDILPHNMPIFLICYVGHTSSQVMVLLKILGYNIISIKFGYGMSPVIGVPVAGWNNYTYPLKTVKKN